MTYHAQVMGLGVRSGVIFHDFSDVYSRLGRRFQKAAYDSAAHT